ncbi:hypothetical protein GZH46_03031 [Fragariocoptes setiger]|uniref:Uncharacterized protein n=1 Tax=Fragariocoptes setiger TaxID=1670756 RepID=A0ABQ7S4X4_9ACAR|nr:hypothetical protein GZH46_03031 [Fragariocoptes setiger]
MSALNNQHMQPLTLAALLVLAITIVEIVGATIVSDTEMGSIRPTHPSGVNGGLDYSILLSGSGDNTYTNNGDPLERMLFRRNAYFLQNKRARKISTFMPMRGKKSDNLFNMYSVAPMLRSRLAEAMARQQQQQQQHSQELAPSVALDMEPHYATMGGGAANRGYMSAVISNDNSNDDRLAGNYLVHNKLRRAFNPMRGKREPASSDIESNKSGSYESMPIEEFLSDPLVY